MGRVPLRSPGSHGRKDACFGDYLHCFPNGYRIYLFRLRETSGVANISVAISRRNGSVVHGLQLDSPTSSISWSAPLRPSVLEQLQAGMSGWSAALELLGILLDQTPETHLCIIHGFDELESEDTSTLCHQILEVLFSRSRLQGAPLGFLFTTSGQSKILHEVFSLEERIRTDVTMEMAGNRAGNLYHAS